MAAADYVIGLAQSDTMQVQLAGDGLSNTGPNPFSASGNIITVQNSSGVFSNVTPTLPNGNFGISFVPPKLGTMQVCYTDYLSSSIANPQLYITIQDGMGNNYGAVQSGPTGSFSSCFLVQITQAQLSGAMNFVLYAWEQNSNTVYLDSAQYNIWTISYVK